MFARKRARYTQERLAEELGVSVRSVQRWEDGASLTSDRVTQIERILGVPTGWIAYDGEIDPEVRAHWFRGLGGIIGSVLVLALSGIASEETAPLLFFTDDVPTRPTQCNT